MTDKELNIEEHATIQVSLLNNLSLRRIARFIDEARPPSVERFVGISFLIVNMKRQKLRLTARLEGLLADPLKNLFGVAKLFEPVILMLRKKFSPQPIAGNPS